jgi:hypothetical protein
MSQSGDKIEHVCVSTTRIESREDALENAVDVIAADVKNMKVLAGGRRVNLLLCVLLQIDKVER